jgi:hypothetical protein
MSWATTVFGASRTRNAQVSSKARVKRDPGRAQGHLLGHHAAVGAVDPAHLAAKQATGAQGVQVTPAADRAVVDGPGRKAAVGTAHAPSRRPGELHHHLLPLALDELDPDHPLAPQPEQPLE